MADARVTGARGRRPGADGDGGSAALLVLLGGGLAVLVTLVPLVVVADLVVSRAQAQVGADAAALAAMAVDGLAGGDGSHAARTLADANGGSLVSCCGDDPHRREVTVGVTPATWLLAAVTPRVVAHAAAAQVATYPTGPAASAAVGRGGRMWPLSAPMTSGFGYRTHPISGTGRLHAGIDLAAATGTPIRAAATGVVIAAGAMGGYGNTVDIDHGGVVTRYAHQSQVLVRSGQRVLAGQVIGLVGSTGASTGPHLHFEVRTATGPIDPLAWLPR